MVTIEIDERTSDGKELLMEIHNRPYAVRRIYDRKQDGIPEGYITAEEWRIRCKKNISEIFRKHEHGLL